MKALKVAGRVTVGLIWLAVAVALGWGAWALITLDWLRPLWIFLGVVVVAIVALMLAALTILLGFVSVAWCFGYGIDDDGNIAKHAEVERRRRANRYWMEEE